MERKLYLDDCEIEDNQTSETSGRSGTSQTKPAWVISVFSLPVIISTRRFSS